MTRPLTFLLLALALPACAQQGVGTRAAMQTTSTITIGWDCNTNAAFTQILSSTNLTDWTVVDTAANVRPHCQATFQCDKTQEFFKGSSK
jgi:hypothetical protein